ncbi:MAG: tautomerase family protein [Hyphomicrobiaceae bacterium]|nr:tautomerase family protein [Hyphomicrobiaceae bacterium]MCC0010985.1 tautomerase family protein [Hyphomicrobiaceae bacterium]
MPLMRIDIVKGRSKREVKNISVAVHRAMVAAFDVPERDRYQIINELKPSRFVMEDTGLDIPRTKNRIMIQVITRPRPLNQKQAFYRLVCEELTKRAGIAPTDVMVSMVENTDQDWSFGHGRAQFLTGEL